VQHGFENSTGGQFFNNSNASLTIGTQTAVGLAGINNEGTIQNSGDLEIMQTTTNGFENLIGGVLNNAAGASMGIGVNGSIGGSGIDNDASISSQGYIDLQNTAQNGISNNNGSDFQNSGTLNIDNTSQNGIEVALNASFDNASNGLVNIGIANANSIGNYGILTDGTILNDDANMYVQHTGNSAIKTSDGTSTNSNNGEIHISDCQSRGLNVQTGSVFINTSTVSIENTSDYALAFSSSGSGWTTLNNSSGELIVTGEIASFLHLGGTLSPGKPIGEVFNQSSFGKFYMDDLTLQIEVNGPNPITEHDQVNGSIVELGGPLALDINFTPTGNERIVFLTAATSLSGTFSSVSPALPANWSLDYSVLGEVALVYDSPFPVELLDFTVEKQEDQVLLNWQTASETNNEGFEILHSTDAANWESIHFMPGAGTSQQAQAYEYLHRLPVYGANYYQLKQIDFDGQFSYSDIRLVNLNGALADFEITLYPNPTPANLNITLPFSDTQGKLQVSALDGRVLLQTIVPANQQQMMISTEAWPEGIYLMKIQIGRQTAIRKFQILR
ncbi:MAG: T9SS type A sorting domain-containing protein, partial [Bacteroidota bacterium]